MNRSNITKIWLSLACAAIISVSMYAWAITPSTTSISNYVPSASVDMKSVELAQAGITILSKAIIISASGASVWAFAESVVTYDLVQALPYSARRNNTITEHLAQLQLAQQQLESATNNYQDKITEAQARLDLCTSNKKSSDAEVMTTINKNTESELDQKIASSVILAQCEAKYRVTINAYTIVVKKYTQLKELSAKKYTLINDNKSLFAQYPEVIADANLVEQLNQLARQIQNY